MENNFYKNKIILVTGGAGSIGSELVRTLLRLGPKTVRVLDINETALFDLEQELQSDKIRSFIGDVKDKSRLKRAFEGVDIIFHAAALKHVPLCEYNPFDAVKTNVIGTQNVMDTALDENVEKVILISTDKAVNPTNVMGATKLLAERLTISANYYKGDRKTSLSCVRFGNVLCSRGSVVPLFCKQIKNNEPITITDPSMTRFIMSIPKAVELILRAAEIAKGGEIFILKMPALYIKDLAEVMIDELAAQYGHDPDKIKLKIIGKRVGEKLYEELLTSDETNVYETEDMFVILPQNINNSKWYELPANYTKLTNKIYSSKDTNRLTKEQIRDLITTLNIN